MRIKALFLIALLLCAVTGVAVHHHEDHCDRQGALLCPVCMVLSLQAAGVLVLALLFGPVAGPGRLAAWTSRPRSSVHTHAVRIRAPPVQPLDRPHAAV